MGIEKKNRGGGKKSFFPHFGILRGKGEETSRKAVRTRWGGRGSGANWGS